jgi:carbonic anhydrase
MRLFDAILDANHRALAGDQSAGVHVADFANELPVVALTCIDPRLNRFFPGVLALPIEHFIWLRNAGNIITSPLSSTMRSLALACAIKGGREIAVIGHTDCQVRATTVSFLTDQFKALGVDRRQLPENLTEYFGLFASERANVIRAVDLIRHSPLIGPKIPVHGLMVDIETGKLEWVVNGYETLDQATAVRPGLDLPAVGSTAGLSSARGAFDIGEMKFPETKIGEMVGQAGQLLSEMKREVSSILPSAPPSAPPAPPPIPPPIPPRRAIPVPPPIRVQPGGRVRRG